MIGSMGGEKLAHLHKACTGAARKAIDGLNYTDAGYTKAKKVLMERFGRRIVLVNDCINAILNPPFQESEASVRSLSDHLNLQVRALETLGVTIEANAAVLAPMLLGKFPPSLKARYYETKPEGSQSTLDSDGYTPPSVDAILEFLAQHAEHGELGDLPSNPPKERSYRRPRDHTPRSRSSVGTMHTQTQQNRQCPQCASTEHRVRQCPSFQKLDPSARYQVAKNATLCFNCLADNHTVSECKSKSNCFNCKSRHHTLLCRKTNRSRKSSTILFTT